MEQLGIVARNWKKLTMEFQWDNKNKTLQGIDTHSIQPTTMKALTKEARQGGSMFAISLQPTPLNVEPEMRQVLQKFDDIFQGPTQLPPTREVIQDIHMKDSTESINLRPYRYAYLQKAEIEKKVQDMIKLGLIRPTTSPFSSLVLLVKKKWFMAILHGL